MSVLIKSGPDIDQVGPAKPGYFLDYQAEWIDDESQMALWEKSFRIGATWADGFKNVRKRIRHSKRDYLFGTKDYPSALEYMGGCKTFCEMYNRTASIVSHGEDVIKVPLLKDGKATGFTEEVKIGYIKFDNESRIIAFTSNPSAMLVYGGDVGLDEFPRHDRAEELWTVAQARVTWGYDIAVWGSHKGTKNLFYQFVKEARAGKGDWSYHRTTIVDAIAQGLVEKINQVRGTKFTREGFLADCQKRSKLPGVFEEAYMCNPQDNIESIVSWATVQACVQAYEIARYHMSNAMVGQLFGSYSRESELRRETAIYQWMEQVFGELRTTIRKGRLGFDIAASGNGDLGSFYLDDKEGDVFKLRGLLTTQTEDWHFMKCACRWFMKHVSAIIGCGDETGLGRNICWDMKQEFPGKFRGVNFSSSKVSLGMTLMDQLGSHSKIIPGGGEKDPHLDLAADYYALQKVHQGGKVTFHETANEFNPASHCDIAWSGALASEADNGAELGGLRSVKSERPRGRRMVA